MLSWDKKHPMPLVDLATSIVKKLTDAGHTSYFAGGWVRDFLMQHPSDDIDIATSASSEQVQALFPKTIPVGISFGIVIVVEGGHSFEVATFRKEEGYLDGRRPTTIHSASPEEDAQRRDFTINGMFWDPLQGKLYDFVNGQEDIRQKMIRAIGDPHHRFLEDRLRMMRAVRYSTRFDFSIDKQTWQAILSHAKTLLPSVAMERIWQEFKKMSQFSHFDLGLVMLHQLDLLGTIFPSLREVSIEEIRRRVQFLPHFPPNTPTIAELLELFPNISEEELLHLSDHLKLSRAEQDLAQFLHYARNLLQMPKDWLNRLELIEWAKFYAHRQSEIALKIAASRLPIKEQSEFLKNHEGRQSLLAKFISRIESKNPVISAQDLIQEGILPGKQMGLLLKEGERFSINEGIEEKEAVISFLKNSPLWNT